MTRTVDNTEDMLDSRDIIARIDELESLIADDEISEENGAEPQQDEDGRTVESPATCGECGKTWNDALISSRTPAPGARCPYEAIHEEIAELATLKALQEEAEGYSADWAQRSTHGATLIRDSYFRRYAQELAEDIGAIDPHASWPLNCIDWEQAARELQQDYTSVDFDGVTYWVR